jgi:hypothetical protein
MISVATYPTMRIGSRVASSIWALSTTGAAPTPRRDAIIRSPRWGRATRQCRTPARMTASSSGRHGLPRETTANPRSSRTRAGASAAATARNRHTRVRASSGLAQRGSVSIVSFCKEEALTSLQFHHGANPRAVVEVRQARHPEVQQAFDDANALADRVSIVVHDDVLDVLASQ